MDTSGLQRFRERAHFSEWEGDVPESRVSASRAVIARLVDEVLALGAGAPDASVEAAIDRAVVAFKDLDESDGGPWIMTIEREDIVEVLWEIADLAGIEYDEEELVGSRDW
jgi:hypothetical protein